MSVTIINITGENIMQIHYILSISVLLGSAVIANPTTATLPLPTEHAKELAKVSSPQFIIQI